MRKQAEAIEVQHGLINEDNTLIEKQKTLIDEQNNIIAKQNDVIENQKRIIEKTINRTSEPIHLKPAERNPGEKIFQYDSNFKVVNSYPTLASAAVAVDTDVSAVRAAIIGKQASSGGYFWSRGKHPVDRIPERWKKRAKEMKQQLSSESTD